MQVISTNVAVRRPDPSGRHEFSGIDKSRRISSSWQHPDPIMAMVPGCAAI